MVGARTFADVLERHLHLESSSYTRLAGIATTSIWPTGAAPDWTPLGGSHVYAASVHVVRAPTTPVGRLRQLTPEQQAALDTLASAAREPLESSFDHGTLKHAFRRAARRLHPDAHPDAEGAARRQLEAAFAAARDAYLTLLALTTH